MKRIEIVGAGLAGLTAAINLAKEGHEVVVYEKEKRIGGIPSARPDPAGSPFDTARLEDYIGINIAPALRTIEYSRQCLWGKTVEMTSHPGLPLYMVERGSRKTSLDSFLYSKAREVGVTVEFDSHFRTKKDFMDLPPGSIIATGLERQPYDVLGIPYNVGYAYMARGKVDYDGSRVTIYMGDYTHNYGFTSTINGFCYAMLFQKDKPITRAALNKFDEDVRQTDDYDFTYWKAVNVGVVPFNAYSTPQLFYGDKILAGTIGGSIEPLMGFGMLGAFLSGKIAAMAIEDRDRALREFRRLNAMYVPELFVKRLWCASPNWIRRTISRCNVSVYTHLPTAIVNWSYAFVPGYQRLS